MKKLFVLVLVIWVKSAAAQKDTVGLNVPFVNGTVVYEKVFVVPNASKNMLYSNAGLWFAETHPYGADTQLQLADATAFRVVGRVKAATQVNYKQLWQTNYYTVIENFTVQVDCKDNTYRIRIYNIVDMMQGDYRIPADDWMQALINSKAYAVGAITYKAADIKPRLQALNTIINNVLADITRGMAADNSF